LATRIKGKKFSELNEKDFTPEEWSAINDVYFGHRKKGSKWTFEGSGKDIFESSSWKKLFGEGGAWDLMYGVSPTSYAKSMIGQEAYEALLIKLLSEDKNLLHESGIMKEGGFGYYTKDEYDAQGNKISGTVVLRLELTDGTYRDIPTIIEDGMMKAIANTPTIQVAQ
jgi:hypothetical protein